MDLQRIINASTPYMNIVTDQLSYLWTPEVKGKIAETASAVFDKLSRNVAVAGSLAAVCTYYTASSLLDLKDSDGYIRKIIPLGKTIIFGTISAFAFMYRTPELDQAHFEGAVAGTFFALVGSSFAWVSSRNARTKSMNAILVPSELKTQMLTQALCNKATKAVQDLKAQMDAAGFNIDPATKVELDKAVATQQAMKEFSSLTELKISYYRNLGDLLISANVTSDAWNKYLKLLTCGDSRINISQVRWDLNAEKNQTTLSLIADIAAALNGDTKTEFLEITNELNKSTMEIISLVNRSGIGQYSAV